MGAVGMGAAQKHPAMKRAKLLATDLEQEEFVRYGLKVLIMAQKVETEDREFAAKYEKTQGVPPVGAAEEAADKIEKEINAAVKKGAPEKHDHIKDSQKIVKDLR